MLDRGYGLKFARYVVRYEWRLSSTLLDHLGPWTTTGSLIGGMGDVWIQQVEVQEQATLRKKKSVERWTGMKFQSISIGEERDRLYVSSKDIGQIPSEG